MSELYPRVDPDGLIEYSVVYTDRSLNHMSRSFQSVMNDISSTLKSVYNAHSVAVVPGSGTFGMEAVARQLAHDRNCLVIRNGWFSYRWTQIFDMGRIPAQSTVLKARPLDQTAQAAFTPPPIDEVVASISTNKPDLVFAPHVETSSGIILPDAYLRAIGDAVHAVGGLFVLDCIASGALWVDMQASGVDVLISAPQKGWSASPCCALVMLSEAAQARVEATQSSSFACDLKKWLQIMQAYEQGGHAYHATMPSDALARFRDVMLETRDYGFETVRAQQLELGQRVRSLLAQKGFKSVAAPGFEAPGVVVCYTDDAGIKNGSKFAAQGLQIAAGVPLQCDEPADFQTFRMGLFGLEKLKNVDRTIDILQGALEQIVAG
ncbi:alanine--glyoxylate aminotransferase family protein [Pseudomonas sp. Choline-3u-10]|jgi:aspartate aminotransferase-like enzyme|uniref:aminotransferase class V-fold PLP-dependent enzyme n=1 Tax=Pseudomonadaceae TaxID=135621 RepID=UPI00061818DE|nr:MULTISPECIES: aminotransferase class V-fold PLP-dependent enzyme [Pseudomonadaceae]MAL35889.1 alanine--glyoxylate aminotransferase family protein [Pseudomonas sp.]MBU0950775.1 aminotransferase class V-fold PLP-dependent enzyme [Gammaproteobacteria bacterium]KJJ65208.1 class V aminotransferase [Pseudomonas sp. 10B238]MBK3795564.1 aminotransferase class V-fold PLP-dependent enzyme [Stutzerimonas stutzeri]MBK3878081.1 aminotransferase class V-fold PLP-dependent enzyme [Stutzerimonas stutzeri]|tara:strand:- start:256 stop:1389 length:1134 start_codon:yes stop_codon:yes gene_type:complete